MKLTILFHFVASVLAFPSEKRQSSTNTAVVTLGSNTGSPHHWASGFIYGIPDTLNQIPDHWYTNMGFNYGRAGGAQLGAPARGWIYGRTEYRNRLASFLSNYQTCRKYGAPMILLPHDIWGTDGSNSSTKWPGDNGDWADYDLFIKTLMTDLQAAGALDGLVFDIWNEPDISIFWPRSIQQWVDLYIRTHKLIRATSFMNSVKISGPSMAFRPLASNPWWTTWLSQISGNGTVPEQYSYHLEGETDAVDNDPQYTNASLAALLTTYKLPSRQVNINEYAKFSEQNPAGAAWWISRLERYNFIGLRGNWASGNQLHDLMANLLTKSNPLNYAATDYVSAGEYNVYKYYNLNMTGTRLATSGSTDIALDTYATYANKKVRVLVGSKITATGTWYVKLQGLSQYGLPTSGQLTIQTWGFPGPSVSTPESSYTDLGQYTHTYSGDFLTFPIFQTDITTAWAFEFNTAV
ncbi:hypothetical protein BP6252_07244 [Coleophoma cylindrospora]|uniref:Glycoside hydrolase family 39 protein n=1 Tax=Coleophoma cylindrospora TaxID=1849047 RepID=A0A3D8RH37_9HELO|nr:hypothetical protein BP6252_07244 [Coleophoma cylindrospora]